MRADDKLTAFVELERQVLTVTFYLESIHPIRAGADDDYRNQAYRKRLEVQRDKLFTK